MNYLKTYEELNFRKLLNPKIVSICRKLRIKNYTINSDGSIDVAGDVDLPYNLDKIPLKFRNVSGNFICRGYAYNETGLTSLQGCPSHVGGYFDCSYNQITSLQGGPTYIGGEFDCGHNQLTSLQGGPTYVGGDYNCPYNQLTSLQGCAKSIGHDIYCINNQIISFEGIESIGHEFYCNNNPVYNIWTLFYDKSKIELFNDYDIIRQEEIEVDKETNFIVKKNVIILDRLNDFLREIKKVTLSTRVIGRPEIKGYEII